MQRQTRLIQKNQVEASIIYPKSDPAYASLAQELAGVLAAFSASPITLKADCDLMPAVNQSLPIQYRSHPLILLGNLNNNRALLPLYASYLCFTDALYPGGDGYELRTIVNPYGMGSNVILAGGSSLVGVTRSVERLIKHIHEVGKPGEVTLPFLLEIELESDLRQKLYTWPDTPLDVPAPSDSNELLRRSGSYGIMYAITGDSRFGELGAGYLKTVNAQLTDSYGDRHYVMDRFIHGLPWLKAGGFLSDSDILKTDRLLLGMVLASQDAWWRMKSPKPPLGHRHHGKGTYEFYLVARYLKEQASLEPENAVLCARWMKECTEFLDALGKAGLDDQDDETTMNNMTTLFWFSLSEELFEFFESGRAQAWAWRAIALHDNMGAAAGPGGYGESILGITFIQHEATTAVASCAFYYQDGRFKWILTHMPRLEHPLRLAWAFCPIFMHKFDTGPELEPRQPEGMTGLQLLPATHYQVELNNDPPIHLEYSGHMVNAPENWLNPEGIGPNHLPQDKGFDKVVLRGGYRFEDPYLLLQGYQGGFRWQGHMKAANCIIRFSQAGHIFLMQNTRTHSQYFKNGILVSDGFNQNPIPPIAEWLALDDFPQVGLSVTRLNDYHHTTWDRHLFWSKGEADFFVVMDNVIPDVAGDYSAVCTWRSLVYAEFDGRSLFADQGRHRFTLRCSESLESTCEEERDQGAANPYVLHQYKGGSYQKGELIGFQNVFYVRPIGTEQEIDIHQMAAGQALILRSGQPYAWILAAPDRRRAQIAGIEVEATSAWMTAQDVVLAGAFYLRIPGEPGLVISSDGPVGLDLNLAGTRLVARIDGPGCDRVNLRILIAGRDQVVTLGGAESFETNLPFNLCQAWIDEIGRGIKSTTLKDIIIPPAEPVNGAIWRELWKKESPARLPERIRDMTVQAFPPPLDGIADQLIDTVTLEARELWQLWPQSDDYKIILEFPRQRSIKYLNLIGDSKDEPIFKVFDPLPDDILVEASNDHFTNDIRPCLTDPEPAEINFKRYRGVLDRMDVRRVAVEQMACQLKITIPAPAENHPLVFQEVEVYGSAQVRPGIIHLISASLDGTGHPQLITVDASDLLVVRDQDGTELWRYQFPAMVSHIACHDLQNDGRQYICVGLLGGDLLILAPDGQIYQHLKLAEAFASRGDFFFGQYNTLFTTCIWQRDSHGRAALAVGAYSMIIYLDPDGEILGHSWFDGPWIVDILVTPPGETGEGDLWARCGWNHGIGYYQGRPGFEPSGEGLNFGGVHQPMFRPLRRLIPFVNGRTAAFEWFTANSNLGRVIVAAAEDGVGVLSTLTQDFLWKVEGGTTLTACIPVPASATPNGKDEVVISGVDGFVAAYDLENGHPLWSWWAGAPVIGLASLSEGRRLVVVTAKGAWALDRGWSPEGFYPLEAAHMSPLGKTGVVIACKDGSLVRLGLSK